LTAEPACRRGVVARFPDGFASGRANAAGVGAIASRRQKVVAPNANRIGASMGMARTHEYVTVGKTREPRLDVVNVVPHQAKAIDAEDRKTPSARLNHQRAHL